MKRTLVGIVLAGLYATASAQGYAGAVAGMTNLDLDCKGLSNCDKKGRGGKVYVGQKFKNALVSAGRFKIDALEASYIRFGNAGGSFPSTTTSRLDGFDTVDTVRTDSIRAKSEALVLAGIGRFEIIPQRFDATAKLGIAYVNSTLDKSMVANSATSSLFDPGVFTYSTAKGPTGSETVSKLQPYFGFGLEVQVIDNLRIVGNVDYTKFESDGRKGDLRLISIGAQYDF